MPKLLKNNLFYNCLNYNEKAHSSFSFEISIPITSTAANLLLSQITWSTPTYFNEIFGTFLNSKRYAGLEISNFTARKHRFGAKQVQETYFENGLRKEKVIVSSYPQSQAEQLHPPPRSKQDKIEEPDNEGMIIVLFKVILF